MIVSSPDGTIPFRLRIGVTGHRRLPDDPLLHERVREALDSCRSLLPSSPVTPVFLQIVSPLAEGADRLVVREALRRSDTLLEVPLPLPVGDYLNDFTIAESQAEFRALLAEAHEISVLPASSTRERAYEAAGEYVVTRADVLIALWDGEAARGRGGTADIVAQAREGGVLVWWIRTQPPFDVVAEAGDGRLARSFQQLDDLNRAVVDERLLKTRVAAEAVRLERHAREAELGADTLAPFLAWLLPTFVRADLLASRYQSRYSLLGNALFLLAAASVAVFNVVPAVVPDNPEWAWLGVLLLLALLGLPVLGRRWHLHEHWIASRMLAERFRSALFLALVDVGDRRVASSERAYRGLASDEWLSRAFEAVWNVRPRPLLSSARLPAVKHFLADAWVRDQLEYHRRASRRHRRRHDRLTRASELIVLLTLIVAVLYALGFASAIGVPPLTLSTIFAVMASTLPAVVGAMNGIRAQREHQRNAERSARLVPYLRAVATRLEHATDLPYVRAAAFEAEELMVSINQDWFVGMQFHDFELHV